MYKYESSLALKNNAGSIFESPDIQNESISSVYKNWYKVYLVLSHPATEDAQYLYLEDVKDTIAVFTGTVNEYLAAMGDFALPVSSTKPTIEARWAKYTELTQAGYQLMLTNEGQQYPTGMDRNAMFDVAVSRQNTNMTEVNKFSLVSVNGFIHDSSATDENLYIRKGAVTARIANTYAAGLTTFIAIGELTRYKLQAEDITQFDSMIPAVKKLRIKVPNFDKGKPYFLVMGGYIIFPRENQFFQVEEDSFALDMDSFDYIERLLESANFIDLRDLNLTEVPHMANEGFSVAEAESLAVLRRYLMLSQSFFVSIDAPNLTLERHVITQELYPNRYLYSKKPTYPLMVGHGRLVEYWPRETHHGYQIESGDNQRRDFLASRYDPKDPRIFVDQTPDITTRHRLSGGYFLEFQSIL